MKRSAVQQVAIKVVMESKGHDVCGFYEPEAKVDLM